MSVSLWVISDLSKSINVSWGRPHFTRAVLTSWISRSFSWRTISASVCLKMVYYTSDSLSMYESHSWRFIQMWDLDILLHSIAESVVVTTRPSITSACLNHLSDWLWETFRKWNWEWLAEISRAVIYHLWNAARVQSRRVFAINIFSNSGMYDLRVSPQC